MSTGRGCAPRLGPWPGCDAADGPARTPRADPPRAARTRPLGGGGAAGVGQSTAVVPAVSGLLEAGTPSGCKHTVKHSTAHDHSTRSQHTITAHRHSTPSQHTVTAHRHSTPSQHAVGHGPMSSARHTAPTKCRARGACGGGVSEMVRIKIPSQEHPASPAASSSAGHASLPWSALAAGRRRPWWRRRTRSASGSSRSSRRRPPGRPR